MAAGLVVVGATIGTLYVPYLFNNNYRRKPTM